MPRLVPLCLLFAALLTATGHAVEPATEPVTPREVIRPFNGRDLSGFTTWLKKSGRADPQHVFRVENGMIRCGAEGGTDDEMAATAHRAAAASCPTDCR